MPYRFGFDSLDIDRRQDAVRQVIQYPVTVDMRLAETTLTMADLAAPQAQVTTGRAIIELFLQTRRNQLILRRRFIDAVHRYATRMTVVKTITA